MHRLFLAAGLVMAGVLSLGQTAIAQDAAAQPLYVVTYMEVAPSSASDARKLLLDYASQARKASGAVQIDALARISDPGHFALIEQWQSQAAKQAFAATEPVTKFRAALNPLQSAAFDERLHAALSVGPSMASSDPVVILTHVDVVPTQVEPGTAKVKAFVEEGRTAKGNRRFDDVVQLNRKNHFTVIESWEQLADKSAWISSKTARTFREELQPMSGALYDERAYKLVR